ncbi:hypothetical protein [Streptomyces sp. NPDC051546]|uniref:hypothetical protein n=1 Tax=Streptomyces sp. NPDC051546 TaxID=3365655 RepID=UPI00379EA56C
MPILFDIQGTPANRRARKAGLLLIGVTGLASTLAAAGASGAAAYRRTSPRLSTRARLATSLAAGVAGGGATLALLDQATRSARRRLSGIDRLGDGRTEYTTLGSDRTNASRSDAKVLAHLGRDIAIDAAYRAANASWCHSLRYDGKGGLLTSRDRWQGHPDGTASLPLVDGCTLRFEPDTANDSSWHNAPFILDDNGTRIEVSTPAALLRHLTGHPDADEADDTDLHEEYGREAFAVDADDGT